MDLLVLTAVQTEVSKKIFIEQDWFLVIKELTSVLASVVSIIGIVAIFISVKSFNKIQEKENEDVEFKKTEKSIELLSTFANEIIPAIEKFERDAGTELRKIDQISEIANDEAKKKSIALNVKLNFGATTIFNNLEHLCLLIESDMVKEDIIYVPLNKIFCDFVNDHKQVYDKIRSEAPYKSLDFVYVQWTDKQRLEENKRQQEILKEEENKIESRMEERT
ncbi:hypothetical protein [Vagococcus fluvialis]|uniref:hypothetical protein n=1 Tax=Vagococcus fluvialis TaxID=2738 RepID=UPI001D09ACB8|nr:hypothetical protein [Vagococcus fluvialis]UDM74054.1 hypothetical protein K5K99_14295 [Vagococcus fluvialis]